MRMMGDTCICALLLFLITYQNCYEGVLTTEGKCITEQSDGNSLVHCCDNREERNGVCIECRIGYASDFGEPCHECPSGTFGNKCGEICDCSQQQRCHHVIGCINYFEDISTSDYSKTPEIPNSNESIGKDTLIYIVCTSGVTFVFTMCMVSFNRFRRKGRSPSVNQSINQNSLPKDVCKRIQKPSLNERLYDEVDELEMIDIRRKQNNQCDVDDDGVDKYESRNVESYLHPYQPVVPDLQPHAYRSLQGIAIAYENDPV